MRGGSPRARPRHVSNSVAPLGGDRVGGLRLLSTGTAGGYQCACPQKGVQHWVPTGGVATLLKPQAARWLRAARTVKVAVLGAWRNHRGWDMMPGNREED